MRKQFLIFTLASAILTVVASQSFCMEKRPSSRKTVSNKKAAETLKITGKATGYNLANSTITVSVSGGSSITITTDKNTVIAKAGKTINFANIRSGDIVTVKYEVKGGVKLAKSVTVETSAPTAIHRPKAKRR